MRIENKSSENDAPESVKTVSSEGKHEKP